MNNNNNGTRPTRRQFLCQSAIMVGSVFAAPAFVQSADNVPAPTPQPIIKPPLSSDFLTSQELNLPQRNLHMYNIHTGESVFQTYWAEGEYVQKGVLQISHHMRDHRENETLLMDEHLLDVLWGVQQRLGNDFQYNIVSGYRSPKTNEMLRRRSKNVARNSLHMRGMACDFNTGQHTLESLRDAAVDLGAGGVGYYPGTGFVHVDTGPVRLWKV